MAALVLGASAVAVPSAHADLGDMVSGGCFFNTVSSAAVTGDVYDGVIGDWSVTTKDAAPTGATVTCWVAVNGVEAPGTRFTYSGTGVQVGADPISYEAATGDIVTECELIVFADGVSDYGCPIDHGDPQFPPQFVLDTIAGVLDAVTEAEVTYVDPAVCPVLVAAAGSYPGGITVAPDGDVYVPDPYALGLSPVWDCPPYGNF